MRKGRKYFQKARQQKLWERSHHEHQDNQEEHERDKPAFFADWLGRSGSAAPANENPYQPGGGNQQTQAARQDPRQQARVCLGCQEPEHLFMREQRQKRETKQAEHANQYPTCQERAFFEQTFLGRKSQKFQPQDS